MQDIKYSKNPVARHVLHSDLQNTPFFRHLFLQKNISAHEYCHIETMLSYIQAVNQGLHNVCNCIYIVSIWNIAQPY